MEGDAFETLPQIQDVFDIVFIDAEKDDYEQLFVLARDKVEPGALVVADNVLSHAETLGAYSRSATRPTRRPRASRSHSTGRLSGACSTRDPRRQSLDPVARTSLGLWRRPAHGYSSVNRGKEVVRLDRFQYGQWRYQRVEACPRDLRGIA